MTAYPSKILFLPGASGNTEFWRPAAERLFHSAQQVHIGWPGFGSTPPDPSVTGIADLVARVRAEIGQSDGGQSLRDLPMPVASAFLPYVLLASKLRLAYCMHKQ